MSRLRGIVDESREPTDDDSSDENSTIENSSRSTSNSDDLADSVEIPETDDESVIEDSDDEEIEKRAYSPRTRMSMTGIRPDDLSTDDDSDEENIERSAYSPQTRRSITGVRPSALSSDEDDAPLIAVQSKKKANILLSDDEDDDSENEIQASFNESKSLQSFHNEVSSNKVFDTSIISKLSSTISSVENKENIDFNASSRSDHELIGEKLSSTTRSENNDHDESRKSVWEPSTAFDDSRKSIRKSIAEKLSSTTNSEPNSKSSVEIIQEESVVFELSSDDEDVPLKAKKMVQPTIKSALASVKQVSRSFYENKVGTLTSLETQVKTMERLYKNGMSLPDKGQGLLRKCNEIKAEMETLNAELSNMVVEETLGVKNEIQKSFSNSINSLDSRNNSTANESAANKKEVINISWDDVKKATDQIQPKFTGAQGIQTFENQKALTIDRLANLHKSLETCPSEDTLADTPKQLSIELMPHQRHGLAWMLWREGQKPRGGILADDMGLGKTLSMISLIVSKNDRDESEDEEGSNSENDSWTAKGRKDYHNGGTLIVCPASLIKQWEGEIKNRLKRNTLVVSVHHGNNRDAKPRHLAKYDVVITTYHIVSREFKNAGAGIFGVKWERIILDEAHVIRNHKAAISMACCELKGKLRWVLTGTPIQNKEMDMYALLKFLKCTPFDDLMHWKKWIDSKSAGGNMRLNTVIKSIMLRRTKVQLQEAGTLNCLPTKNIEVVEVQLDKEEMNVYQKVLLYSKTLFSQFLHQRAEKENAQYYADQGLRPTFMQSKEPNGAFSKMHQKLSKLHVNETQHVKQHQILVLLLRLRQICCHAGLIDKMLDDDDTNLDVSCEDPDLDLLEQLTKMKILDGETEKVETLDDSGGQNTQQISRASSKVMMKSNPVFDLNRMSSKISRVFEVLEDKIFETNDKAVVVSQWTSLLNILAQHLKEKGVRFNRLDGTVPVKNRNDLVIEFNKVGSGPKIMLLSLCAGGVGLNLIGGNHLLLLDLHWNPQLEAQAQDRVYRVGQNKPVYIYQFMCVETVEQKIKALQEHKLGIASGVLTGAKNEVGSKLTIDDLKSLFGL